MATLNQVMLCSKNKKILSDTISQVTYEELDIIQINHPTCKAAIALQGAHLIFWQPKTEVEPVIWVSEESFFKKAKPIRGGVPVCWPWFGGVKSPAHGFARIVDWQLTSYTENEKGVDLVLTLASSDKTQEYWPNEFELSISIHLGITCEINLSCKGDFEATSALHTYFGVSDIANIKVTGLGPQYEERLANENKPNVVGEMTINQEVDRIYSAPEAVTYIKDKNRNIKITHINNSDAVLWNPWSEKSKSVVDFADDSYKKFVCVETCRINKPIVSNQNQANSYGVKIDVAK